MIVIKRDKKKEQFSSRKIKNSIKAAYNACNIELPNSFSKDIDSLILSINKSQISVEEIEDEIEKYLVGINQFEVAKCFILYREKHKQLRFIKERTEYIQDYVNNIDNAATASEIDANSNVQHKNVATLEAELYKTINVEISRYRITKKLKEMYGNKFPNYNKDLDSHIIYKHDESSSPAIKPYCVAVNMYPFLLHGSSTLDGLKTEAPKNLTSFAGQFNNLIFLLSSQFAGAIACGEFFNIFNYYAIKEFGEDYYKDDTKIVYNRKSCVKTISDIIEQTFQNIVYTINQPAGNRSFQSPFTNISYYDSNYWKALFEDFVYPDGTKPNWNAVNYLQKKFMIWFNKERQKTLLTFPVNKTAA